MSRQRTNPRVRPTRGKTRVEGPKPRDKLSRLVKRPGVIVGNSGKLEDVPTFDEAAWRKKWDQLPEIGVVPVIKKAKAEGKKTRQKGVF